MTNAYTNQTRLVLNFIQTILFLGLIFSGINVKAQENSGSNQSQRNNTYTNPVLKQVFPDPSIIRAPNGWFYAYGTNSYYDGKMINIQVAKSKDLVHWKYLGDALPKKPEWANHTQQFWAPDITYDKSNKTYYLYFASGHNNSHNHCIGVAISKSPKGPFTDIGHPLVCGKAFSHIDPMEFTDPKTGKLYMLWGSDFYPIQMQRMAKNRIQLAPHTHAQSILKPFGKSGTYNHLIEASWLTYHKGYYYLFYSGNNCCGVHAHYSVMVARSRKIWGPYERFKGFNGSGNGVILKRNAHWMAPGHNAIITTDHGKQYWILYHAINPNKRYKEVDHTGRKFDRRVLMLDRIIFKDGWPRVKKNSPSYTAQPSPIVK